MTSLRVIWLSIVTALRAAPLLTSLLCLSTVVAAVTAPLAILGISLLVAAAAGSGSLMPGFVLLAGSLVGSSVVNGLAFNAVDTVDDKVSRFVHDDLMRIASGVPTIAHHENPELADRMSMLERDAHQLGGAYRMLAMVGAVAGTATVVGLLWTVHPLMCLLLVIALVPAVLQGRGESVRHQLWLGNERHRRVAHRLMEVLSNPRNGLEVRCFGLLGPLVAVAASSLSLRQRPWMAATRRFALLTGVAWVVFGIAYAGCVGWTLAELRAGRMGLGSMTLVLLVGPQIVTTGQTISASVRMVASSLNTFGRYEWLRRFAAANSWSASTLSPPERLHDGIRLDHVDFAYPSTVDGEPATSDLVLRDISLTLPAGRTIAFVGENGAGKSTLVKLLARMYDPSAGALLVDGVPMTELDPVAWRSRISAGFQDFASLEFVLHESVSVGDLARQDDRELIGRAVSAGQAESVVAALGAGMETQLGSGFEDGVGLSGGQWQRIALARAFMRERPLLMLLDEPTAALDPEAEQAIYQQYGATARALARETGAVTVLVSHRFSTVRMADLIAVVADGRIAEVGSHAELMRAGGAYAQLFELQAGAYR